MFAFLGKIDTQKKTEINLKIQFYHIKQCCQDGLSLLNLSGKLSNQIWADLLSTRLSDNYFWLI